MMVIFDDDEVFLSDDELFTIDLVKDLRLEDIGWRTGGVEPGFEEYQTIHAGTGSY
jgi:hypothetical protein